jgi:DNA-directed RNA polymerase subunit RPC12/RpoP
VRSSSLASRPDSLVCALCEASKLHPSDRDSMRCESCGARLSGAMLETLRRISALPDALGSHACECGHPVMRRLPDGTYHCPACGSEVLPIDSPLVDWKSGEHDEAYWAGWVDGRFGEKGSFVDNPNLVKWENPLDRLAYYRGHRAGSKARQSRNDRNPNTREKLFG